MIRKYHDRFMNKSNNIRKMWFEKDTILYANILMHCMCIYLDFIVKNQNIFQKNKEWNIYLSLSYVIILDKL